LNILVKHYNIYNNYNETYGSTEYAIEGAFQASYKNAHEYDEASYEIRRIVYKGTYTGKG